MGDMKTLHSVCVGVETPTLSDLTIVECVNTEFTEVGSV